MCFAINNPDSLENINEKWAPEIAHFCPKVPIILVGNKGDLRNDPAALETMAKNNIKPVTTEDAERMARIIGAHAYMECSAKTRDGVREIFETGAKLTLTKPRYLHSTHGVCRLLWLTSWASKVRCSWTYEPIYLVIAWITLGSMLVMRMQRGLIYIFFLFTV